ncbi:thermonuclease family protein [Maricaulis sp.]|uniref:thermonuclease family protein n=1 Tax=Maricaulis sp. TaxID=1486257 RepID=UPI003A8CF829
MTRHLVLLAGLAGLLALQACEAIQPEHAPPGQVREISWSDGDSGHIDGERFRLADIDAPETGTVGSRSGARCELERQRGREAKAWMVSLTRSAVVTITGDHGADRYGRRVLRLSVDGEDLARTGITAGYLQAWPHRNGRAQTPKPDWCGDAR